TGLAYVTGHRIFSNYLDLIYLPGIGEATIFCGSMVGASMGFLWWNCYPARIFMGDVGSLSLGGALGTVAILIKQEILLVAIGGKPASAMPASVTGLAGRGVLLELREHRLETFRRADLVVVSPGVPWDSPELAAARDAGAEVVGELEFGWRFVRGRVAAITGTKGKSTTTAALGAMLRESGMDARVGGNIGTPV